MGAARVQDKVHHLRDVTAEAPEMSPPSAALPEVVLETASEVPPPVPVTSRVQPAPARAEAPAPIQPVAPPLPATAAEAHAKPPRRRPVRRVVLSIVLLAALARAGWYGEQWWTVGRFMTSTDDAYVSGDIATISSKLGGYVGLVNVVANQRVKAGDPIVTLDSGDFEIAVDQAQAQIDTQNLALKRFDAQITGAQAGLTQAQAQKTAAEAAQRNAAASAQRTGSLGTANVTSKAQVEAAQAALDQANANVAAADAQISAAEAQIAVLEAQRNEAASQIASLQLSLKKAQRDLGFTVVRAPIDGVVGNLSVQTGDLVSAGQRLAALVPVESLYVDANFKETQLKDLAVGEKVKISVDAIGQDPIEGTIASISPASGSVFSLLPAENATGNFTKVVQRVPVRIALPPESLTSGALRAGLSVVVEADSRTLAPVTRAAAESAAPADTRG